MVKFSIIVVYREEFVTRKFSFPLIEINKSLDFRIVPKNT